MKTLQVVTPPMCNFCGNPATYDAPTFAGPWAYVCDTCAETKIDPLGTGMKFIVKEITKAHNPGKIKLGLEDDSDGYWESVLSDGVRDVKCPGCGASRHLEPDASGEFTCEFCDQRVRIPETIF